MTDFSSRTEMLIGADGVQKLQSSSVLVVGLGGVGGSAFEALVRAGVGRIGAMDNDAVSQSNLNRQILATTASVGRSKADVAAERAHLINPNCRVEVYPVFYPAYHSSLVNSVPSSVVPTLNNAVHSSSFPNLSSYDFVIDCIDTVSSKVALAVDCKRAGVPLIASMSTGNKLHAAFEVADVYSTHDCPLSKAMRSAYRATGEIDALPVVFSPLGSSPTAQTLSENGRHIPGSISFIPPMAGLVLVEYVVCSLLSR